MDVKVPDIGDFSDVPVISVLVSPGDTVAAEDPLIELESDKATMEVPSPAAGTIEEIRVKEGDTVSEGSLIMVLDEEGAAAEAPKQAPKQEAPKGGNGASRPAPQAAAGTAAGSGDVHGEVVVLG